MNDSTWNHFDDHKFECGCRFVGSVNLRPGWSTPYWAYECEGTACTVPERPAS